MFAKYFLGLVACSLIFGCATTPTGPVKVDGSTPAAFRATWHALEASLSANKQAKLNTAILLIGATKLHDSNYAGSPSFGPETLRGELNGKTYQEILDAANATGARITGVKHRGDTT